ncbi:MAG: DUF1064 domain-containing protein [Pedobacter sp.]|nr:DUF1064 domain-containing protein [Pedobacter sp.]
MKPFTLSDLAQSKCADRNRHLIEEPKKKNKYRNQKTDVNGIRFDSKKESKYYKHLMIFQKLGMIGLIERQVKYELIPAQEGERACNYYADFRYVEMENGEAVVCDVKSEGTRKLPVYIMKRKLMLEKFNIKIKEA